MPPKKLYHWTHSENVEPILREGLLLKRALSEPRYVYAVSAERIGWAWLHIAARHSWPQACMTLLEIDTERQSWGLSRGLGVFRRNRDVPQTVLKKIGYTELTEILDQLGLDHSGHAVA